MSPIVLDASIVIAWCFDDDATGIADETIDRMKNAERWIPSLLQIEVTNTLSRIERKKQTTRRVVREFLGDFESMELEVDHEAGMRAFQEIYGLCQEFGLTAYDAVYLELAMRKGAVLATLDQELRRAAVKAGVPVVTAPK